MSCRAGAGTAPFFTAPAPAPAKKGGSGRLRLHNTGCEHRPLISTEIIFKYWNSHIAIFSCMLCFCARRLTGCWGSSTPTQTRATIIRYSIYCQQTLYKYYTCILLLVCAVVRIRLPFGSSGCRKNLLQKTRIIC